MLNKVFMFVRQYGVWYTIKKVVKKCYVSYLLGPLKINRKLSASERKKQEETKFEKRYIFSILVPLYNTPEKFLREMIESVLMQTYGDWQLCLADGSDDEHTYVEKICSEYARADSRICYEKLEQNLGISENTNFCIKMAKGDYIALFDHDDLLHPSALYKMMEYMEKDEVDLIYTDEATFMGREGHLLSVHEKPDFYMENLRANNYICHFTAFKRELLEKTGMFRKEFDGSQDHDLILRLCEKATKICHIPEVLYFWRAHENSVALNIDSKRYTIEAGEKAVREHLERCGLRGEVDIVSGPMSIYTVDYQMDNLSLADVAVVRQGTKQYVKEAIQDAMLEETKEYVFLLTKEIMMPTEDELHMLLMHMAKPQVAAVTGKIIGKNGKIYSGDVKIKGEKIKHMYRNSPINDPGYMRQLTYASGIPVICNGCMLVRKEFFAEIGEKGLDVFDMETWKILSEQMRKAGYELINESRVGLRRGN